MTKDISRAISFYFSIVRMYPRSYRKAFGDQMMQTFKDHYQDIYNTEGSVGIGFWFAVITDEGRGILREHLNRLKGGVTMKATLKQPSAWLPLAMSFVALADVLGYVAMHGTARQADEGAAAHTWQLLMAVQLPIVLFFAASRLGKDRKQALVILALQALAYLAALAPVYLLKF